MNPFTLEVSVLILGSSLHLLVFAFFAFFAVIFIAVFRFTPSSFIIPHSLKRGLPIMSGVPRFAAL